jgi:hypothetical protein
VIAPPGEDAAPLLAEIRRAYLPDATLARATEGDDLERQARVIPWLRDKNARDGRPTAYVCERRACRSPTSDPAELAAQLAALSRR